MSSNDTLIFTWMEFLTIQKGQRPRGVKQYEKVARSFLSWLPKAGYSSDPATVTRDIVGEWMKHLFYDQNNISNSSRASKLSALRSFFQWLKYARYIEADPTDKIPSPRVQPHLPQKFSTEELRLLFAAPKRETIQGKRDLAMLMTMYAAGPRVHELVGLNISSVIDSGGYIRLQITGKGGKERTVTLRTRPSRVLREWVAIRKGIQTDHAGLFVRLKGPPTRLTDKSVSTGIEK